MSIVRRYPHLLLSTAACVISPAYAQVAHPPVQAGAAAPAPEADEIVVTAPRLRGSVISDVPPVVELNEQAVASYGAASITELLAALSPQTGPGRGRGSGGPVVLLNGQRISGFAEIRDLPPEAILRVQVLPEEVALQYGYAADQRVVNFILKDNFHALTTDAQFGASTAGKRTEGELQSTLVSINGAGRLTLTGEYDRNAGVLERDRGIIQPAGAASNAGSFRSLLPSSDEIRLNGVYNRKLSDKVGLTLNASYQDDKSQSLLGLAPFSTDVALGRNSSTAAAHGGLTLTGSARKWVWTITGNYDQSIDNVRSDRTQTTFSSGRTQSDTSNGIATISGPALALPAGAVNVTAKLGFATARLNSLTANIGDPFSTRLARDEGNGRLTVEVPIANRDRDVLPFLGKFSVNANFAYRQLSDFGVLSDLGYGLNWQPFSGLTFLASAINTDVEPKIVDLGGAVIVTPNVPTYDFGRAASVLVTQTSGGNPALLVEKQRDSKFSLNYQPEKLKGLSVEVNYYRNRSQNPVASFPTLTPDIEAAFVDRVTRNADGTLTAIDTRPVNYAATRSDVVRVGFTFQKEFGQPAEQQRPGGGGGGGPRPGGGGGGFGRGGGGFGRPGGQGGRWTIALYDSIRFRDEIEIRPGLPVLDLLGGNATGDSGGAPRHSLDLDSGWFNNGLGIRLTGSYASGSTVIGTTTASTLRFGDLATLNANAFINFDNRKALVMAVPFLKGARLRLSVQNLTNAIRDVRDGAGTVPLNYQPGYVDPTGRFIKLDFRKRF